MPLDKSGSKASIGRNIKTEEKFGKPKKQSIAIALNVAREAGDRSLKRTSKNKKASKAKGKK